MDRRRFSSARFGASLAASVGEQIGALVTLEPGAAVEPFPVAMDLEAASGALERCVG